MADPQVENGYTRIATELLEALMRMDMPGAELRIALVVARKTYGWQKLKDQISLSQFCQETGMTRTRVIRAIKNLVRYSVLGSITGDTSHASTYWIIKDYDKWTIASIRHDTSIIRDTRPSIIRDKNLVSPVIPTIDTTQKIIYKALRATKKPPDTRIKVFIDWWCLEYKTRFDTPYSLAGKDFKLIQGLISDFGLEELKRRALLFLSSDDEWIKKVGFDIGIFKSKINTFMQLTQAPWDGR